MRGSRHQCMCAVVMLVQCTCLRFTGRTLTGRRWACRMCTAASEGLQSREIGPAGEAELAVTVKSAGAKGMGAYAAEAAQPGRWVGRYHGPLVTLDEQRALYSDADPEYLFKLTPELYIDGNTSTHFTRYFNHDQNGNLNFTVSAEERRVDFFAAAPIAPGDELCFDYGVGYWVGSVTGPAQGTDSRDFSLAQNLEDFALPGPPPLTPRSTDELQAALQLPEAESRAALLRCLEFFGSNRVSADEVDIPLRLPPLEEGGGPAEEAGTEPLRERVNPACAPLPKLEAAAARCVREAELRRDM